MFRPMRPRVFLDEVAGEQRNVFGPLAKGRDMDWKDVQPVVEIGAEIDSPPPSASGRDWWRLRTGRQCWIVRFPPTLSN